MRPRTLARRRIARRAHLAAGAGGVTLACAWPPARLPAARAPLHAARLRRGAEGQPACRCMLRDGRQQRRQRVRVQPLRAARASQPRVSTGRGWAAGHVARPCAGRPSGPPALGAPGTGDLRMGVCVLGSRNKPQGMTQASRGHHPHSPNPRAGRTRTPAPQPCTAAGARAHQTPPGSIKSGHARARACVGVASSACRRAASAAASRPTGLPARRSAVRPASSRSRLTAPCRPRRVASAWQRPRPTL